jgi:hypothetical protein
MKILYLPLALLACANAGLLVLSGCESSSTSASSLTGVVDEGAPPAGKAEAAVPAGYVRNRLLFPTGVRETSQLALDRTAPGSVMVGQSYDSTLVATNISNTTLHDVVVADNCSTNYKLDSATPAPATGKEGILNWPLGELGPGESKTIVVHGSATGTGTVRNCMSVTFSTANCVTTAVVEPKLTLTASATADTLKCNPIVMQYTISNPGTGAAQNVTLQDALPGASRPKTAATRSTPASELWAQARPRPSP